MKERRKRESDKLKVFFPGSNAHQGVYILPQATARTTDVGRRADLGLVMRFCGIGEEQ